MLKDLLEIAPILIALLALIISFWTVYASKKKDIEHRKFDEICLQQIELNLEKLYQKIEKNHNKSITKYHIQEISKIQNDLLMKLEPIKSVYSKISIVEISEATDEFSDGVSVFAKDQSKTLNDLKPSYYELKTKILISIYNYALTDIFSFQRNVLTSFRQNKELIAFILLIIGTVFFYIYLILIMHKFYALIMNW